MLTLRYAGRFASYGRKLLESASLSVVINHYSSPVGFRLLMPLYHWNRGANVLDAPAGSGGYMLFRGVCSTMKGKVASVDNTSTTEPSTIHHDSSFLCLPLKEEEMVATELPYALVMLNHSLPLVTPFLWNKACLRVCADGGANQLYDLIPSLLPYEDPNEVRKRYIPDVIKGDLDSIRPEVKNFYAELGTHIINKSYDQTSTDLWKCLSYIKDTLPDIEKRNMKLVVVGALGGRLDHVFANINTLYLFRKLQIVLLSNDSMAFLLRTGFLHEIQINSSIEGPYCGLLPVGSASISTTTTGLKWNLDKSSIQFGGLISTSNMPESNLVTVHSDTDLLWTISVQKLHVELQTMFTSRNTHPVYGKFKTHSS